MTTPAGWPLIIVEAGFAPTAPGLAGTELITIRELAAFFFLVQHMLTVTSLPQRSPAFFPSLVPTNFLAVRAERHSLSVLPVTQIDMKWLRLPDVVKRRSAA